MADWFSSSMMPPGSRFFFSCYEIFRVGLILQASNRMDTAMTHPDMTSRGWRKSLSIALSYHWGRLSLKPSRGLPLTSPWLGLGHGPISHERAWNSWLLFRHMTMCKIIPLKRTERIGSSEGNQWGPLQWLLRSFKTWFLPTSLASSFATHLFILDPPCRFLVPFLCVVTSPSLICLIAFSSASLNCSLWLLNSESSSGSAWAPSPHIASGKYLQAKS